jgi:hypothetical protein
VLVHAVSTDWSCFPVSGAVSLTCWRPCRWSPVTRPTYGVQREWDSCSIRHLAPPADYSHNTPGIESGPGCGAVYGSNAPQGARSPERAAATLAPEPRFPSSAAMAATRGGARPALRGSSLSRLRGPLQVLHSFPAYRCGVRPLMHMSHDKYGL